MVRSGIRLLLLRRDDAGKRRHGAHHDDAGQIVFVLDEQPSAARRACRARRLLPRERFRSAPPQASAPAHPASRSSFAIAARFASPISTTSVALPGASERSTGPYAASAWPETTTNADARPRCVTGIPESSGAAIALEIPGTISHGMPGRGQRERLLAAASEHKRIAALQPDHAMAATCLANHQPIDRILTDRRTAGAFPDEEPSRVRRKPKRRPDRPARRRERDPLPPAA